ncbi:conserved hypothetical protein [Trichormus variabilis ATCC 29413]|uniref:PEP-CTERM protein-sorting domain-containing protein n=2 Tax=Anabaena variabilis TaxID=264691 RepID=Q3MFQ1_TRIV2|nr:MULTISPECIES: choice-of-anchor E domain-containing protein [Nostocaceae]ABA20185.1 conserved hypothetical protein [Trichormus variabilis ATCC 29413]MBC1215272.1 choice-of-anchor E domain-containing protein [Trichormus variabilis ARAD]MBC1255768.1 choice-of-anchor E domain-containing protein [Trichormus variabilis V5]MBC1269437.1 choice-of-anchor E domain-containing protein [Trichormus variabilis FSR]MBC1303987.1 choice-of-anchor E domain-containing protein [Trichormus variabilis N2B]
MTTTLFKTLGAATTLAGIIATAGSASAASLSYTSSTAFETTDIENSILGVQKFNSSLGTLQKVTLNFVGDLTGNAEFENKSRNASTITVKLNANLSLSQPDLVPQTPLLLDPENLYTYQVAAYDGTDDKAGASGRKINTLAATKSTTSVFTDTQFLQAFTGTGNIDFLFSALANSVVTGSGNISSGIETLAKASVTVTYEYEEAKTVPESSTVLGLGLIAGLGLLSQRKQNWLKTSGS